MKSQRPVIDLPPTRLDKLFDQLSLLTLVAVFVIALYSWYRLPQTIPIHFDIKGHPDNFGPKETLLILPCLGLLMYIFLGYLNRRPHLFNYPITINETNAAAHYRNAARMMRMLKLSIMLIFLVVVICSYLAGSGRLPVLPVWILPVIIGLALLPTVYFLVKAFKQ